MGKIVADFVGTETSADYEAKLITLGEFMFGPGSFTTRGDLRKLFNDATPPERDWQSSTIEEQFRPHLNWWNDTARWFDNVLDLPDFGTNGAFLPMLSPRNVFRDDGVTPVFAGGQRVSLIEPSEGFELGPELIVNGDFLQGSTGWNVTGQDSTHYVVFDSVEGTLRYVSDTTSPVLTVVQTVPMLVIGRHYLVECEIVDFVNIGVKTDSFSFTSLMTYANSKLTRFTGVASNTGFTFNRNGANVDVKIKRISVREILNVHAYQVTPTASMVSRRRPKTGVRNLLKNSDLAGAVAGTPGTAPTGWTMSGVPGTLSAVGEGFIDFLASANRPFLNSSGVVIQAGQTITASFVAESALGVSVQAQTVIGDVGSPAGVTRQYRINGNPVAATALVMTGDVVSLSITAASAAGAITFRMGLGCDASTTATLRMRNPQVEIGTTRTAYQRTDVTGNDVSEAGVPEVWSLVPDLVDDVLPIRVPAGFSGSVAILGENGSWLEEGVSAAVNGVLNIGPLNTPKGTPIGMLRAFGSIVGVALFDKQTVTQEDLDKLMRVAADHGAKGWFVKNSTPTFTTSFDSLSGLSLFDGASVSGGRATLANSMDSRVEANGAYVFPSAGLYEVELDSESIAVGGVVMAQGGASPTGFAFDFGLVDSSGFKNIQYGMPSGGIGFRLIRIAGGPHVFNSMAIYPFTPMPDPGANLPWSPSLWSLGYWDDAEQME